MSYKNTKTIGNIGEAKAISEFIKNNVTVLTPFGDNEPYDLVIELNGQFKKIQVKTSDSLSDTGLINFKTCKTTFKDGSWSKEEYLIGEIDYFVFYSIKTDLLFILDSKFVINNKMKNVIFSLLKENNLGGNSSKKMLFYKDFLLKNFLNNNEIDLISLIKEIEVKYDEKLVKRNKNLIDANKNKCKNKKPSKEELFNLLKENSFTEVGRMFGVIDNSVRKWCKKYEIPHLSSYYKNWQ